MLRTPVLALAASLLFAGAAQAQDAASGNTVSGNTVSGGIAVSMNQARIVKMSRPIDTIVIGNSQIADAAVQDSYTIVLTGKGFGVTNMVVLDADGAPIADEQVIVSRHDANSLRVYRRAQVQTMSCTPFCESATRNEAETASDQAVGSLQ